VLPLVIPATAAWARGDGWQPLELPDEIHDSCGSTPLLVTFPVNNEYFRTTTKTDGTVVTQVTGRLTVTFTTPSASLTLNISGPSKVIEYPNGDVELITTGLTGGPPPVPSLGLPHIIWTAGRADIIFHPDDSFTVVQFPNRVIDVCAELGAS
jgi:hypothetical protein